MHVESRLSRRLRILVDRRSAEWIRLSISLLCLCVVALVCNGCMATFPANKPVLPTPSAGDPVSSLMLDNYAAKGNPLMAPYYVLLVEVDGFSPTAKLYLPTGATELLLPAGHHEIRHYMVGSDELSPPQKFRVVTTSFETKPGGKYTITFRWFGVMHFGYNILYEGWSEEEKAQWPTESRAATPF